MNIMNAIFKLCILFALLTILHVSTTFAQDNSANPSPFKYTSDLITKADAGDMTAQFQVGYCYYGLANPELCKNSGVAIDRYKSFNYLEKASKQGHVYATYLLGCFYYYGYQPIKQNYKKALTYFEKATEKGCLDAIVNLGQMYEHGYGVSKDARKSESYTRQAAEQGSAVAQYNMYIKLMNSNPQEAYQWLEKAAGQDHSQALNDLGLAYMNGNVLPQNTERGLELLKKATAFGNAMAFNNIGCAYSNGTGVEKDYEKAALYFYEGAKKGVEASKNNLQLCYNNGAFGAFAYNNYGDWVASLATKNLAMLGNKTSAQNAVANQQSPTPVETPSPAEPVNILSDIDQNIPTNATDNDNTFAVIFANENYQEEVKVDYALNDGESFKTYCEKVLGLPSDNIHFRKDATLNNMRAEMSWLQQVASAYKGRARFIIYYAGHGIPDEKTGSSYLLPVDGKGSMLDTGYSLAKFYQQLGQLEATSVTIFMDACFSGSKRGEGMLASARGVAIKAKPQQPKGKMVVFSAAQGDETAYPLKTQGHGLFTYYLLKKLKESNGNVTYGDLSNYITDQVARKSIVSNGKSQTPSVTSSVGIADTWKGLKLK